MCTSRVRAKAERGGTVEKLVRTGSGFEMAQSAGMRTPVHSPEPTS